MSWKRAVLRNQAYLLTEPVVSALPSIPAFYSQWKGSCHFASLQGGCVLSRTCLSGVSYTAEDLMIFFCTSMYKALLDLLGRDQPWRRFFFFFFLLGCYPWKTKALIDVVAFTCVTVACMASVHRSASDFARCSQKERKNSVSQFVSSLSESYPKD